MSGDFLAAKNAKSAKASVAGAPDVARAPSPLQQDGESQGRGGLATSAWRKGGAR